ncbi:MAG: HAMP domain-containing protein [Eubacteriales bacterium]
MKTSTFNSLKIRNSLILISVMVPLFISFLTYEVNEQSQTLRRALTERGIILAQTGAATIGKVLGDSVENGKLTEKQLFDTGYQVIPGTNPPKYHTKYDSYTDTNLRVLEDSFLKDNVVVYAVAVDINGYLPTHNTKYSIPGGGLNYDRSKRVFKDEVGLAAAHNKQPYKFQEYKRDTGEVIWDISAPIYVNGRHWGAFRLGFSIEETNKQIAAAMNRMIFSGMFLTLVLVVLAIYISNRISNRVKLIAEEANRVAGGDLTPSNLALDSKDEVGNLSRSFNNMVLKLRDLAEKSQYNVVQVLEFQVDKVGQFILVKRFTEVAGTLKHVVGELQETLDTIKL